MELHPYLEKGSCPNSGLWYVLSAIGECPSVRVGLSCSYAPGLEGHGGKVLVLGGANPSETFGDLYVLDLDTFSWDRIDSPGFKPRYEHSAFIPKSKPNKLYAFGGGDQHGNHRDVQVYDLTTQTWSTVTPIGEAPSARTYHITAVVGDKFYVYSGGQSLSDPVSDRQVHCFDAAGESWTTLKIKGDAPKPRHGHVVVAVEDKLYIHGGMSGTTFYDDMHVLDLKTSSWSCIKQKRGSPSARAAHAAVVSGSSIYVFGGMNRDGALDDLHMFDTKTKKWSPVSLGGPAPASRLDMGACVIKLSVPNTMQPASEVMQASKHTKEILETQLNRAGSAGSGHSVASTSSLGSQDASSIVAGANADNSAVDGHAVTVDAQETPEGACGDSGAPCGKQENKEDTKIVEMFLVLGGMDTEGEIFDDCLVFLLA